MASVSESLECSVCIQTFNLTERLPRALVCHHTVCGECLEKLKNKDEVRCPTCRRMSPVGQVAVNYTVTDVLRALCQDCAERKQKGKCGHCDRNICEVCEEQHARDIFDELLQELSRMDELLNKAIDASKDTSVLNRESNKLSAARESIKAAIQQRRDALGKLEEKLLAEVTKANEDNVTTHMTWEKSFDDKVVTVKDFSRRAKSKIGQKYDKHVNVYNMMQMLAKCQTLVQELSEVQNNPPVLNDYTFVASTTFEQPSVGNIIMKQNKPQGTIIKHHNIPDYTTLRYNCMTGSEGSEPHQLNKPVSVTCTSDQIIVADQMNHRVKFYDNNLTLQFAVGEHGSGQGQFDVPSGLAVGPEGEVFVSDQLNHRIVVLSPRGEYLREIGSQGTGDNQLSLPVGIDISDGLLFIADAHNYRVKVVKSDGTFVRHIGSKGNNPGQFENYPARVAVMSPGDGRVMVEEYNKSQLHVYTGTGQYLGLFPPSVPRDLVTAGINDVTVDNNDNILITYTTAQLAVYNKSGVLITVIGSRGSDKGQFIGPAGVAVNTTERFVIVCDCFNHRVQKIVFNYK